MLKRLVLHRISPIVHQWCSSSGNINNFANCNSTQIFHTELLQIQVSYCAIWHCCHRLFHFQTLQNEIKELLNLWGFLFSSRAHFLKPYVRLCWLTKCHINFLLSFHRHISLPMRLNLNTMNILKTTKASRSSTFGSTTIRGWNTQFPLTVCIASFAGTLRFLVHPWTQLTHLLVSKHEEGEGKEEGSCGWRKFCMP